MGNTTTLAPVASLLSEVIRAILIGALWLSATAAAVDTTCTEVRS